jgi:hypothetical protein
VRWKEGLRYVFLTESTRGRLRVLGVSLCAGVYYTWIPDGDCQGNLAWSAGSVAGRHEFSNSPILLYIIC